MTNPSIAFFWGDDDLAAGRAVSRMADAIAAGSGGPVERFDLRGDRNQAAQLIGQLQERVATQSMFGGGTLGVVTNVGALTVKTDDRDGLLAILPLIAPGSGVAFVEATASGAKEPGQKRVVDAVRAIGGEVRAFRAPKAGELAGWIESEARERDVRLAPGAARELALRVGGFVLDNDADRRNQTRMTGHELDKLALYRPTDPISADDVKALVPEAVPGSVWAFTDAIGLRDAGRASGLLDRLSGTTPEPVLLAVLHRRIRELLEVADHLAAGTREETLPRTLGLHPFRVQQLATQARRWSLAELEAALEGLLELDASVKGAPGSPGSDAQRRLGFTLWLVERVGTSHEARSPRGG
jgi:DNA polymerase III delta subunit